MKKTTRALSWAALLLAASCAAQAARAEDAGAKAGKPACATTPAPRSVEYPWMSIARWREMFGEQVARARQGDVDVMFLGDSITEMWTKSVWDENFSKFKPANFGIGGDNTGNVLWRLQDPAIANLKPKLVVLLIGVNNINLCGEKPEEVFLGIQAVVAKLRELYPSARILLNAVLPEGELPDSPRRRSVVELDKMVATLGDGKTVFFRDYGPRFVGADGKLSAEIQPDFLHLSEKGYRIWAAAMRPDIEQLLAKDPNPEQARRPMPGPVAPGPDDVRAFAAAPAGFAAERAGVAHGRVEEFSYQSAVTGGRRKAQVYLPPGYSAGKRYPVLYLLHGIGGNQDEWRGYVRAATILDNLNADGKAVPAIVVMPNGRALPDDRPPPSDRMFSPEHVAGFAQFEQDLLASLVPAIDRHYPTLADRSQRAIAGLSMGGGQALNFGLGHTDTFAWVAGFSSAPNTQAADALLHGRDGAQIGLKLLYLSCGNKDGLFGISQSFHRYLKEQGIAHVWNVDEYGHDRESWADNLYHFSQLLFR
jgi:enterochelin esterase-like enzyme/lysophospholipase L1-like esterase